MKTSAKLNTKKRGIVTVFNYKEGLKYISVCLELDIVKEGKVLEELIREMKEAVEGHIKTVCKENLSDDLLNRQAPKRYWKKYEEFVSFLEERRNLPQKRVESGVNIFSIPALCAA